MQGVDAGYRCTASKIHRGSGEGRTEFQEQEVVVWPVVGEVPRIRGISGIPGIWGGDKRLVDCQFGDAACFRGDSTVE